MSQVTLNIKELKELIKYNVENNRFLQERGKKPITFEVEGTAGLGKTSCIKQIAQEMNLNFQKLSLSQLEELGDLCGFPIRQFQMCKEAGIVSEKKEVKSVPIKPAAKTVARLIDGKLVQVPVVQQEVPKEETAVAKVEVIEASSDCIWVDEHALGEYIKLGYTFTGNKRMDYCPPPWVADKGEGYIFLIDDYTRADVRMIQACMDIIDQQEYVSWKLPKDWHIILSSNPDSGNYLVNSMDIAQKTRYTRLNLVFDIKCWAEWAEREGIDGRCINFLLLHPELVKEEVNPRSITNFFNSIFSIQDFQKDLSRISQLGEGSVGQEFTQMFTLFINNKLDKLVKPEDILLHENETYIIGELRSCIGTKTEYRADIASILATRVMNYSLTYAEKNSISDAVSKRVVRLVTDPDIFTDDLNYHMIKTLLNGNKQKWQKLMTDKKVVEMAVK